MNRIAGNLFALQTYRGSPEKMLRGRLNEVGKGRRGTSLPSNFASITLLPQSSSSALSAKPPTSFSMFLPQRIPTRFA